MHFDSLENINRYLDSMPRYQSSGRKAARFDLDSFRRFCEAIDSPHEKFDAIHIAGTNGKGSTAQIIASIYQQAGLKAGLYTSPHILSYSERFRINGMMIQPEQQKVFFEQYESIIKSFRVSYFELSTAIAFWWFARQQVDVGVIETGLGGRLDATNIIRPLASVITNVTLDHTDILGSSVREIAREKAGIIKDGVPAVLGNISAEPRQEIAAVARQRESPLFDISDLNPRYENGHFTLSADGGKVTYETGLEIPVQAFNIALAVKTVKLLDDIYPVQEAHITGGIKNVRTRYPALGRFERLREGKTWYFDGAHNLEAVKAMKQMIETLQPVSNTTLVLSMMKDKVNKKVMKEFSEFKKIFYHSLETERAASFAEIQRLLPGTQPFPASQQLRESLFKEYESELVIFAGSFYFYSTVRDWLTTFASNH